LQQQQQQQLTVAVGRAEEAQSLPSSSLQELLASCSAEWLQLVLERNASLLLALLQEGPARSLEAPAAALLLQVTAKEAAPLPLVPLSMDLRCLHQAEISKGH
jgi:hypothetical protein